MATTALVAGLTAGAAGAQSSGNPFLPQPAPITIPAPTTPAPRALPSAAYDQARGAAATTGKGQGGWLPVVGAAACPPGRSVVTRGSAGTTDAAAPASSGASGDGAKTKKATAATPATAAPSAAAAESSATRPVPDPAAASLRAGSSDDNEKWLDYLIYRRKFLVTTIPAHDLDIGDRHVLRVVDESGRPVLGARVDVSDEGGAPMVDLRTYADGRTIFFPRLSSNPNARSYRVRVTTTNGASGDGTLDRSKAALTIVVPKANAAVGQGGAARVKLDVQFLIDTTGSMQDEIDRLRNNMLAVSQRIAALPSKPDVRFGMTVYRDCSDEFISRTYDFDADVNRFNSELNTVRAGGGGDNPEHLNQALHDAIARPGWRGDDTVKLVFLLADAPPHLDYPGDYDYAIDTLLAARRGIKISPIASSGADPAAEFVFRQMAVHTLAKFVFLTYGADGVSPGDKRPDLNVDAYDTLPLDLLVARLAQEEVTWQGADPIVLPALPNGPANLEPPILRPPTVLVDPYPVPGDPVITVPRPRPTSRPVTTKNKSKSKTKTRTTTKPRCVIVKGTKYCR